MGPGIASTSSFPNAPAESTLPPAQPSCALAKGSDTLGAHGHVFSSALKPTWQTGPADQAKTPVQHEQSLVAASAITPVEGSKQQQLKTIAHPAGHGWYDHANGAHPSLAGVNAMAITPATYGATNTHQSFVQPPKPRRMLSLSPDGPPSNLIPSPTGNHVRTDTVQQTFTPVSGPQPFGQPYLQPTALASNKNNLQQDRSTSLSNDHHLIAEMESRAVDRRNASISSTTSEARPPSAYRAPPPPAPRPPPAIPFPQNLSVSPQRNNAGASSMFTDPVEDQWEADAKKGTDLLRDGWHQIMSAKYAYGERMLSRLTHLHQSSVGLAEHVEALRKELSLSSKRLHEASQRETQLKTEKQDLLLAIDKLTANLRVASMQSLAPQGSQQREEQAQREIQSLTSALALQSSQIMDLQRRLHALRSRRAGASDTVVAGPEKQQVEINPILAAQSSADQETRAAEHTLLLSEISRLEQANLATKEMLRRNNLKMGELGKAKDDEITAIKAAHDHTIRDLTEKFSARIRTLEKKTVRVTRDQEHAASSHEDTGSKSSGSLVAVDLDDAPKNASNGFQSETAVPHPALPDQHDARIRELSEELSTVRRLLAEKTEEADKADKVYAKAFDETEKAYKRQYEELKVRMEKLHDELEVSKSMTAQGPANIELVTELEKRISAFERQTSAMEEAHRNEANAASKRETELKAKLESRERELILAQAWETKYKEAKAREDELKKRLEEVDNRVRDLGIRLEDALLDERADPPPEREQRRGRSPTVHGARNAQSSSTETPADAPSARPENVDRSPAKPHRRRSVSPTKLAMSHRRGTETKPAVHPPVARAPVSVASVQKYDPSLDGQTQGRVSPTRRAMSPNKGNKRKSSRVEALFLDVSDGEMSPVATKRARLSETPARSDTSALAPFRTSVTPIVRSTTHEGIQIDEQWIRDNVVLCSECLRDDAGRPRGVICKVCFVDRKNEIKKNPSASPEEIQRRLYKLGSLLDQPPLPVVKSLDEPDLSAVVQHLRESHETTLVRLKIKREREGKGTPRK